MFLLRLIAATFVVVLVTGCETAREGLTGSLWQTHHFTHFREPAAEARPAVFYAPAFDDYLVAYDSLRDGEEELPGCAGCRELSPRPRSRRRGRELEILRRLEVTGPGISRPLPLVVANASLEPGVFGIWRPVLLWPSSISARLTDAQIEAILAHELAHVRRRDNLAAALHMAVQSLFWFHPAVWWISHVI